MASTSFVIGLGSNRRHGRHGAPVNIITAAVDAIAAEGLQVHARSNTLRTPAMGPAGRSFANAAIRVETHLSPPALLALLKAIERRFGRRPGRRWGSRVLDLDMLAWSGGAWSGARLTIPHAGLSERAFALRPAAEVAPGWRHPGLCITLRQLEARRRKPHPVDRRRLGQ